MEKNDFLGLAKVIIFDEPSGSATFAGAIPTVGIEDAVVVLEQRDADADEGSRG